MKVKLNGNDFFDVSAPFGNVSAIHTTPHRGIDLVMESGTELFSPVEGVVTKIVDYGSENLGKGIFIETSDHRTVILGHLSEFKAKVGQHLNEGDLVALSGNTGRSTGSHLHLGLRDSDGSFINPESLLNSKEEVWGWWDFLQKWKAEGFWEAMYDKPFSQVIGEFLKELGHDIGIFILGNGDLFFLIPAVIFFIGTWIVGRHKYTKWTLPLMFAYVLSRVFYLNL